jgi:Mg2+/citrate symporter
LKNKCVITLKNTSNKGVLKLNEKSELRQEIEKAQRAARQQEKIDKINARTEAIKANTQEWYSDEKLVKIGKRLFLALGIFLVVAGLILTIMFPPAVVFLILGCVCLFYFYPKFKKASEKLNDK